MARHADFRHDGDKTLGRVGDDLAYLMPTVVAAVAPRRARGLVDIGRGRGAGRDPPGADLGQPGPAGNVQPPALIVGQMPVEHVHFVQRQPVDVAFDVSDRLHMPGRIEHQPAPLKTRLVDDAQRRDGAALGQQLRQGGQTVIQAGRGLGLDAYTGFIDAQLVGLAHARALRLGGQLPGPYDRKAYHALLVLKHRHGRLRVRRDPLKQPGQAGQTGFDPLDGHAAHRRQGEFTSPAFDERRVRNDRGQGGGSGQRRVGRGTGACRIVRPGVVELTGRCQQDGAQRCT